MTHFRSPPARTARKEGGEAPLLRIGPSQEHLNEQLHGLARYGDGYAVEEVLRLGADIDGRSIGAFGTSPIMSAVRSNRAGMVKLLLRHGADPLKTDYAGWNAISWAAIGGDVGSAKAIIEHLQSKGEDIASIINRPDQSGQSALDLAYMHPEMQAYLSSLGAVRLTRKGPSGAE